MALSSLSVLAHATEMERLCSKGAKVIPVGRKEPPGFCRRKALSSGTLNLAMELVHCHDRQQLLRSADVATRAHASGNLRDQIPTTLTMVNSNLHARAHNMDSQPIGYTPVIPHARKSENKVVNVVRANHHLLAGPKIDQKPTDKAVEPESYREFSGAELRPRAAPAY